MTFQNINSAHNLCIFCYKSIPPEYPHNQNAAKFSKFCEILTRLLGCQNTNMKQKISTLLSNSFCTCKDCEMISTQVSDIYHELKCLELRLYWKLEALGKVMKLADKVPSRKAFVKACFKNSATNEAHSNSKTLSTQNIAFKTFRKKIKINLFAAQKMSIHQPRVLLTRCDKTADITIPKSQVVSSLKELNTQFNSDPIFQGSISFFAVLHLLSLTYNSSKINCDDRDQPNKLVSENSNTDDELDKLIFETKTLTLSSEDITKHCSSELLLEERSDENNFNVKTSTTSPAPTDFLSEMVQVNDDAVELTIDSDAEQLNNERNKTIISKSPIKYKIKIEQCDDEYSSDDGNDIRDNYSDSCESSNAPNNMKIVKLKLEVGNTLDYLQEFDQLPNLRDGNENIGDSESKTIHYNFRKRNTEAESSTKKELLSSTSNSETSDMDEDYEPVDFTSNSNVTNNDCAKIVTTKEGATINNKKDTSFICQECGYSFRRKHHWKNHMEYHKKPEDWKFECSICQKKCVNQQQLNRHTHNHTATKPWQCDQCGKKFPIEEYLKSHLKSHLKLKRHSNLLKPEDWKYQCSNCGKKCASIKDLRDHVKVHSDERPWICEQCGKGFKYRRNFKEHLKCHSNLKSPLNKITPESWKYECSTCGKKCASNTDLNDHVKVHSDERPWICKICEKGFKRKRNLRKHEKCHGKDNKEAVVKNQSVENQHDDIPTDKKKIESFICEECGSSFKRKGCLIRHKENHKKSEDWKYTCSICKKKFPRKQQLTQHMIKHITNKLWECEKCGKKFKTEAYLKGHLKWHLNLESGLNLKSQEEWEYQCTTCGKRCATKKDLEDHLQNHSDERPWICDKCKKGFKRKRNLTRHVQRNCLLK